MNFKEEFEKHMLKDFEELKTDIEKSIIIRDATRDSDATKFEKQASSIQVMILKSVITCKMNIKNEMQAAANHINDMSEFIRENIS